MDYASRGDFATGNRTVAGLGGLFLLHAYEIDETEDWNPMAEGSYCSDR